jgi:LmbE family N-acetylglucosaminyl deacetylase
VGSNPTHSVFSAFRAFSASAIRSRILKGASALLRRLFKPLLHSSHTVSPAADSLMTNPRQSHTPKKNLRHRLSARVLATPVWQRFLVIALALPMLAAGGGASAYYYRLHRWSYALKLSDLPTAPAITSERRILVISPHCDDETLGVGALISDARKAKIPVTIAFLTNGDGFRVAASRTLGEVEVSPADFVRFAEVRQKEALSADAVLGVPGKNVVFMGYPDRGLKPMWEQNWKRENPFRSFYTKHTHSPYNRTYSPRTPYAGEALLADLIKLMNQVQPTDIYVTHPADDHPDHYTAAAFAQAALRECRKIKTSSWAAQSQLHFYIVHRGDWPLPQGLHTDRPLLPPTGLTGLDTKWTAFTASPRAVEAKEQALEQYVSQTEITGRFLRSFVRINEIFGEMPIYDADPTVSSIISNTPGDAHSPRWTASTKDAAGDDVIRFATPSADLTGITVQKISADTLRVSINTQRPASSRVRYTLLARSMGNDEYALDTDKNNSSFLQLDLQPILNKTSGNKELQADIPLSSLGITGTEKNRCVWIAAETRLAAKLPIVDRVGYRAFDMSDSTLFSAKK